MRLTTCIIVGLFLASLCRLVSLQLLVPKSEDYKQPNYSATYELLGLRGRILDRNGSVLAESVPGRVIYIDRKDPKLDHKDINKATLVSEVSQLLGISEEIIADAFSGARTGKVGEISDNHVLEELRRRTAQNAPKGERLAGINFSEQVSLRVRPNGARLSHVLGFINAEGAGVYGIEQRFNKQLTGKNGHIKATVDARRREIRDLREDEVSAEQGHDIVLTIDANVQYIIEQALSNALKEFEADSGMIIVQKVDTGEILGMATLPSVPPENYGHYGEDAWKNIAISRNFEPGSVMKPLIIAMAIEHGVIQKDSVFQLKSPWYYAGRPLSDHIQSGPYDVRNILAKSSNIGTALIGLEMAKPNERLGFNEENHLLWTSFRALGLGQLTGIDLVGEERGILPHYSKWSKLSATRMPIGQGVAVTGIQLCTAYSALANGGKLMRPMIVLEERQQMHPTNRDDYRVVKHYEPEVQGRPFSKATGDAVVEMLTSVVEKDERVKGYPWSGGTGRRAQLPSYIVAGKTGTAQIPINGRYSQTDYNASFVGIYPATKPQITILVTIERPKGARHTGGNVAAPIFASVAEEVGNYLYLPADKVLEDKK